MVTSTQTKLASILLELSELRRFYNVAETKDTREYCRINTNCLGAWFL